MELRLAWRPRVLLADDYPEMVNALSRLLELDCEIVGIVADGSALLQEVQRLQPDVIVLDVNLPNVHSLEACREIARDPHDESDHVHGDGRPGRQPGVLRGGSICLRIKNGGSRPAFDY